MKYFQAILLIMATCCVQLNAQTTVKEYPWEIGFGIGYTNYYGDLSNYRINTFSDISKIYHFADYNHYYVPQPSFSLLLEKKINSTMGFMLQLNQLSFSMSDRYRNKNGTLDLASPDFSRALNFKTSLQDAGFALTFSAANGHAFKENSFFYPSFFLGGGVAMFSVYGDLYDANGNAYDYSQTGNINDGHYETNLRDLKTETQNRYSNITPYLDFGLALNFRLNDILRLSIQSDIKYSGTDYLDDVSARYKTSYPSAAAAYAAHPGTNTIDPVTRQRGDKNDANDIYINNRLVLHVSFSHKKSTPAFKPPVLYSLSGVNEYKNYSATVQQRPVTTDSTIRISNDTVLIRDTIPVRQYDTAYQQRVEHRLDSIQQQLKSIKTVIRNQAFEAKYQYLHFEQDSVRRIKKTVLAQKTISREDNLKVRIYDLQLDSLQQQLNLLQRRAETGMEDADSSWRKVPSVPVVTAAPTVINNTVDTVKVQDTVYLPADSINKKQLDTWNSDFKQFTADQRYAKDSMYRKMVDSLNKKIQAYQKTEGRDSAVKTDSIRKDTSLENSLLEIKNNVQKNTDSLQRLQLVLQQNKDSASYYKRLAFAENEQAAASPEKKRKWYQKIVPHKSVKEDKTKEADEQRIADREKYYDDALQRLNDQVNTLQRRNTDLNNDYERNVRRRTERVYTDVQPIVRENGISNMDRNELRNEINALRNQLLLQQTIGNGLNYRPAVANTRNRTDTVFVQAPVSAGTPASQQANPQMVAMQQEINRLKAELDTVKRTGNNVSSVAAAPVEEAKDVVVYFALGSAKLSPPQESKLFAFIKKYAADLKIIFSLTGYTDATGNQQVNRALAKKRTVFVQNLILTQYDIPAQNVQINDPEINTSGGKENPLDRKVVISIK